MEIRPIEDKDIAQVIALWEKCGLTRAYNDPLRDLEFALSGPSSEILVGEENGVLIASALVGFDGHRGYVYYVACDPDLAGRGYGRAIMQATETWLKERGVWKLNLMIRETNTKVIGFYEAIGYENQPRAVMAKWLEKPTASPQ